MAGLVWALSVLLFLTLVCCQPTDLSRKFLFLPTPPFLANILHRNFLRFTPPPQEFGEPIDPASRGSGDVKYHLGASCDRVFDEGTVRGECVN